MRGGCPTSTWQWNSSNGDCVGTGIVRGASFDKHRYSGSKITESLGNVTVRGEKDGKSKGERDGQQSI
jgi:hypothetical protein